MNYVFIIGGYNIVFFTFVPTSLHSTVMCVQWSQVVLTKSFSKEFLIVWNLLFSRSLSKGTQKQYSLIPSTSSQFMSFIIEGHFG